MEMPSEVSVPGLYDLSGVTSFVGVPTSLGSRDAIKYANENDILPTDIDHEWTDYSYEVPQANQAYEKYTQDSDPPAIIGWGTSDTQALGPKVARDEIVYVSASYSEKLLSNDTPYNFFGNLDYASQMRCLLKWVNENDPGASVGYVAPNAPSGNDPVEPLEQYAESIGLDFRLPPLYMDLGASTAESQVKRARDQELDYVLHNAIAPTVNVLLRSIDEFYPELKTLTYTWGVDENFLAQTPDLYEDVTWVNGFKSWGEVMSEDTRGSRAVQESFDQYREDGAMDDPAKANLHYPRGFIHTLLVVRAIQNAAEMGLDVTNGSNLREGFFAIDDWNVWGLAQPFSYQEGDRRPTMNGRIYQISDGALEYDQTIELPRNQSWIEYWNE
jgi:branched-chain amino acid transport system substrate-binding protein